jgi:hypothetical protein
MESQNPIAHINMYKKLHKNWKCEVERKNIWELNIAWNKTL